MQSRRDCGISPRFAPKRSLPGKGREVVLNRSLRQKSAPPGIHNEVSTETKGCQRKAVVHALRAGRHAGFRSCLLHTSIELLAQRSPPRQSRSRSLQRRSGSAQSPSLQHPSNQQPPRSQRPIPLLKSPFPVDNSYQLPTFNPFPADLTSPTAIPTLQLPSTHPFPHKSTISPKGTSGDQLHHRETFSRLPIGYTVRMLTQWSESGFARCIQGHKLWRNRPRANINCHNSKML